MTKKQHQSAEIHKESKTEHKNKSLKQVTRGIAENTESLICGRTENISGDSSDPAFFICSKYTHGVCSSQDALKRESEPQSPKGLISCESQATDKHINSFSIQDSNQVSQEALAAAGGLAHTE